MSEQVGKIQAIPIYKQIEQNLRHRIRQRDWPAGSRLPSRLKLAKEYQVGLPTLEQAIQPLLEDGTLQATPRGGTFVAAASTVLDAQRPEGFTPSDSLPSHSTTRLDIIAADIPWYTFISETNTTTSDRDWATVLVRSLESSFSQHGGMTHFVQRYNNSGQIQLSLHDALAQSLAHGANALALINVVDHWHVTEELRSLSDGAHIPVVLLSWEDIVGPLPQVVYDHAYGGYLAAQHLLHVGYSPILFMDVLDFHWARERLRGVKNLTQSVQLVSEEVMHSTGGSTPSDIPAITIAGFNEYMNIGYAYGKELLTHILFSRTGPRTNAPGIIAPNDDVAIGLYRALSEAGLIPGEDFGLVGFDDRNLARSLGITSLRPPLEEIGQEATQLLFRMLRGDHTALQVRSRSHLIVRASTTRTHARGIYQHPQ